jgi:hypothetical protein
MASAQADAAVPFVIGIFGIYEVRIPIRNAARIGAMTSLVLIVICFSTVGND